MKQFRYFRKRIPSETFSGIFLQISTEILSRNPKETTLGFIRDCPAFFKGFQGLHHRILPKSSSGIFQRIALPKFHRLIIQIFFLTLEEISLIQRLFQGFLREYSRISRIPSGISLYFMFFSWNFSRLISTRNNIYLQKLLHGFQYCLKGFL